MGWTFLFCDAASLRLGGSSDVHDLEPYVTLRDAPSTGHARELPVPTDVSPHYSYIKLFPQISYYLQVQYIPRAFTVLAEALVLAFTWCKTYTLWREEVALRMVTSIPACLLRDGTNASIGMSIDSLLMMKPQGHGISCEHVMRYLRCTTELVCDV